VEVERRVQLFTTTGCGCRLANNTPCSSQFSSEHHARVRGNAAELSWNELNMTIMGQVMVLTQCDSQLNCSKHRHSLKERETFTTFNHQGYRKKTLFLHGIGEFRLKAIKASYLAHGLVPQVHGHTGRISPNALVLQDIWKILSFVMQYAEANAIYYLIVCLGINETTSRFFPPPPPRRLSGRCTMTPAAPSLIRRLLTPPSSGMEAIPPTCHRGLSNDRPVLGLSAEQHSHCPQCKSK